MNDPTPIPRRPDRPAEAGRGRRAHADPLLSPLRELELVEAFRAGDPEAVGTLLRSYQRRMFAVCYRMVRNDEDARDLTQESMVKVLEGLATFDARARLSTWVIRVTMNCCLSHLRKRKLRRHLSLDAPGDTAPSASHGEHGGLNVADTRELGAAAGVERDEASRLVVRALDSLDPDMRAVLVLRDMQDLDYQQIAEVIDAPVGTVKSRLFRARAALREAIDRTSANGSPRESA
jgi:RNA polymerase sigma-70 factor (ECF subfamily)